MRVHLRQDNALESLLRESLGKVLPRLHKQLQALRSEVSYGMGGSLRYTRHTFEGVEEDNQADKKGENG